MPAEIDRSMLMDSIQEKRKILEEYFLKKGMVAIAFSGGVDSTFLLAVAHDILGDCVLAITETGHFVPEREIGETKLFCKDRGIRHAFVSYNPLEDAKYRKNGKDRCYVCKRGIFTAIKQLALENGIAVVVEGSNMDDLGDYRPGMKAIEELGVESPLREAKLNKQEIRLLSKTMGLSTWNKPAYACLATRIAYGEEITVEKLKRIESAEQILMKYGFLEERVRIHGDIARIEVAPQDIGKLAQKEMREAVCDEFMRLGFLYVTLDLKGYRSGSMNALLKKTGE